MKYRLLLASAIASAASADDAMHRELDERGSAGIRMTRSGKGSKGAKGSKSRKHGSAAPSSKSGKSSDQHDPYYFTPLGCPNMCVDAYDAHDLSSNRLDKALSPCVTHGRLGDTQKWLIDDEDGMIRVESYAYDGHCIGVKEACLYGTLALLPCHDPAAYWYFTGGQLASFLCWAKGVSSTASVAFKEDEGMCHDELVAGSGNMISAMSTFMFVTTEDMEMFYDLSYPTTSPTISPTDPEEPTTMSPSSPPTTKNPTQSPTFFPSYLPTTSPFTTIRSNPRGPRPNNRGVGARNGRNGGPTGKRNRPERSTKDDDDVFHLEGRREI